MSSFDAMADHHLARLDLSERRRLDQLLEDLINVLDSFDRLLGGRDAAGSPQDGAVHAMARSVEAIAHQLERSVAAAGLQRFGAAGDPLDLNRHVVVGTGPGQLDTVTAVERGGYEREGRVIRPAEVIVGQDGGGEPQ